MKYLAYLILIINIGFNLYLYYPETQILADPNDNIFQFSLVNRTNWVWENYGCPLSLSCLPNLIDHNVPNWAEGYPLPFYYSHVPQIATVASYNLIVKPLSSIIHNQLSLYQYYNWTKYLLLTFFPLSVFLALRIVGFSPVLAALGAFFGTNFSTDGLYGIDPPSYLWRGYGLTSQLYALIFLPLAIAFTYRSLSSVKREALSVKKNNNFPLSAFRFPLVSDVSLSILFLTLTAAGHLGVGIIGILSTIPFLFFDLKPRNIWERFKKLFIILTSLFLILSYWIIPILLNNNYHIISFWDPIWKFDSYGWYEVVKQFWNGEIFDWQRFPIITALVLVGFFANLIRTNNNSPHSPSYFKRGLGGVNLSPFSLLFSFWFLLYFGRTTWGGLIDLIPGMKDFHQHRFVVGVHIAALFLIPAGLEYLFSLTKKIITYIVIPSEVEGSRLAGFLHAPPAGGLVGMTNQNTARHFGSNINITFYIVIFIIISALIYFTTKQTVSYATLNNKWIYQANDAYRFDEKNFQNLLSEIDTQAKGRVYAGRPGNWGKDFRLGSTQLYLLLGGIGYDISQFLPETWSPLSENEQNFDEREALDYDLLNIKYIVSSNLPAQAGNENFAPAVKLKNTYGPFKLYQAPTTGWFDIVTSPMFVKSDKTNYINLVHLWWNSYPRRWKMHPLISVENNPNIPQGMQKFIRMTDEVNYTEGSNAPYPPLNVRGGTGGVKNIFSDYPFVFPEATISGKIKAEKVEKQTYSATVEVPNNCKQCFVMFKMSYHPDWIAKIDGEEVGKFAVFPFYLAIPATPGIHTVEFTYAPNRLKVILLIGELLIGILFLFRKKFISLISSLS